jgi:hypothetical protein
MPLGRGKELEQKSRATLRRWSGQLVVRTREARRRSPKNSRFNGGRERLGDLPWPSATRTTSCPGHQKLSARYFTCLGQKNTERAKRKTENILLVSKLSLSPQGLKRFSFGNSSALFSPPRETSAVPPYFRPLCKLSSYPGNAGDAALPLPPIFCEDTPYDHFYHSDFSTENKTGPSESPTSDSPDSVIFPRHFPSQPITEHPIAPPPRCFLLPPFR